MNDASIVAALLGRREIDAVSAFYAHHAPFGLRYPRDRQWVLDALGKTFYWIGAKYGSTLVGATWITYRARRPYFTVDGGLLRLYDGGPYVEVGGTLVREDFRRKHVNDLLCASAQAYWFAWPTAMREEGMQDLWARVAGKKAENGTPVFWALVGETLTGLSYADLLLKPFDALEDFVFDSWPKNPLVISALPAAVADIIGRPSDDLVAYQRLFPAWGFHPTNEYVVTSLNAWCRCRQKEGHIPRYFVSRASIAIPYEEARQS